MKLNSVRPGIAGLNPRIGILPVILLLLFLSPLIEKCNYNSGAVTDCATIFSSDTANTEAFSRKTRIQLNHVRFMLSSSIYADMQYLDGDLIPRQKDDAVDFDRPESFQLNARSAGIGIDARVLEALFNNKVFNYNGSPLRNLSIQFIRDGKSGLPRIFLKGEIYLKLLWIPFTQVGRLELDTTTNNLVMQMDSIQVLGSIPTLELMNLVHLKLEELVKLPADRGVVIRGNDIILRPFDLFPPPRISGKIDQVKMDALHNRLLIYMGALQQQGKGKGGNPYASLHITGGVLKFARFYMHHADLLLLDSDAGDEFVFNLPEYIRHVNHGRVEILKNGAVRAVLPDFNDI